MLASFKKAIKFSSVSVLRVLHVSNLKGITIIRQNITPVIVDLHWALKFTN